MMGTVVGALDSVITIVDERTPTSTSPSMTDNTQSHSSHDNASQKDIAHDDIRTYLRYQVPYQQQDMETSDQQQVHHAYRTSETALRVLAHASTVAMDDTAFHACTDMDYSSAIWPIDEMETQNVSAEALERELLRRALHEEQTRKFRSSFGPLRMRSCKHLCILSLASSLSLCFLRSTHLLHLGGWARRSRSPHTHVTP